MPAYVIANIDVKDPVRQRLQENVADQHSAMRRPLRRARRQVRRAGRVVDAEAARDPRVSKRRTRARVVGVDRVRAGESAETGHVDGRHGRHRRRVGRFANRRQAALKGCATRTSAQSTDRRVRLGVRADRLRQGTPSPAARSRGLASTDPTASTRRADSRYRPDATAARGQSRGR